MFLHIGCGCVGDYRHCQEELLSYCHLSAVRIYLSGTVPKHWYCHWDPPRQGFRWQLHNFKESVDRISLQSIQQVRYCVLHQRMPMCASLKLHEQVVPHRSIDPKRQDKIRNQLNKRSSINPKVSKIHKRIRQWHSHCDDKTLGDPLMFKLVWQLARVQSDLQVFGYQQWKTQRLLLPQGQGGVQSLRDHGGNTLFYSGSYFLLGLCLQHLLMLPSG